MNNNSEYTSELSQDEKRLLIMLLFYCIGVSICRLIGAEIMYISFMDLSIYREDILVRLPYYLMPVIALVWLKWKHFSIAGLFFTCGFSLIDIFNHALLAPFIYITLLFAGDGTDIEVYKRIKVLIIFLLIVFFAILIFNIFRTSKRLFKLKSNDEAKTESPLAKVFALFLLLFCYTAPFIESKEIAKRVSVLFTKIENVKVYNIGSRIDHLAGSPDGKLLAIGAKNGVFVWDSESQECVWSDDALRKVHRLRFSPSGKYLAAGGRGVPEGSSDIVIYLKQAHELLQAVTERTSIPGSPVTETTL